MDLLWAGFPQQKQPTKKATRKKIIIGRTPPIIRRRRTTHDACSCHTKKPVIYQTPPYIPGTTDPAVEPGQTPPIAVLPAPQSQKWSFWNWLFPPKTAQMSGTPSRPTISLPTFNPIPQTNMPTRTSSGGGITYKPSVINWGTPPPSPRPLVRPAVVMPSFPTIPTSNLPVRTTVAAPTILTPTTNTVYVEQPAKKGTSLKLNQIFEGGLALTSQWLSAFGKNPSTQIGNYGAVTPAGQLQQQGYTPEQIAQIQAAQAAAGGAGSQTGSAIGSGIDGILSWAQANFGLVALGGVGLFLLFRQPPGRRS